MSPHASCFKILIPNFFDIHKNLNKFDPSEQDVRLTSARTLDFAGIKPDYNQLHFLFSELEKSTEIIKAVKN